MSRSGRVCERSHSQNGSTDRQGIVDANIHKIEALHYTLC